LTIVIASMNHALTAGLPCATPNMSRKNAGKSTRNEIAKNAMTFFQYATGAAASSTSARPPFIM